MARPSAGSKVKLRTLLGADAAELARAVQESREELKRRYRWAESHVDEEVEAAFIENNPLALAVVESKTGELAGIAAAAAQPDAPGLAELKFWIRSSKQGAGLGTDAALNMSARAFKGKIHKLWARVDPGNRAGRRVLKKLGFRFEGCLRREKRLTGRWADLECWGLLKEERA